MIISLYVLYIMNVCRAVGPWGLPDDQVVVPDHIIIIIR